MLMIRSNLMTVEHVLEKKPNRHVEVSLGLFLALDNLQLLLGVQTFHQLARDVHICDVTQDFVHFRFLDVHLREIILLQKP